ncbi:hypothetical protein [Actinomadura sp. WAC 06369]|uniref:hypothetical protein n=1 Tax=Actinomadura sp. WAC 06369 TaxID=2203193 RepID=UPI000F76E2D0|nr:hypothetical protein [Actinomadura sp. WAC 06369]RSN40025.1 hypothetical protein DMH08_39605 [Actinomadura sp. WAC 06369]
MTWVKDLEAWVTLGETLAWPTVSDVRALSTEDMGPVLGLLADAAETVHRHLTLAATQAEALRMGAQCGCPGGDVRVDRMDDALVPVSLAGETSQAVLYLARQASREWFAAQDAGCGAAPPNPGGEAFTRPVLPPGGPAPEVRHSQT